MSFICRSVDDDDDDDARRGEQPRFIRKMDTANGIVNDINHIRLSLLQSVSGLSVFLAMISDLTSTVSIVDRNIPCED